LLIAYCHRLLHITTIIEEGDDIVAVTFFVAKPPKKRHRSPISCGKAIEEGDGSYRLLLLLCFNETITK